MKKITLDTQIFLWAFRQSHRLSSDVIDILQDSTNEIYLSAASVWEIAIKFSVGKLELSDKPEIFVPDRAKRTGLLSLPIFHEHALGVTYLPPHHKDPFDRLLIVQAQIEGLTILTADPVFRKYTANLIDAEKYKKPINSKF